MELLQQIANTNYIRIEEVAVEETALQVMIQALKKKLNPGINNEMQEEDDMQFEAWVAEEDETKEERTQDEDKDTPEHFTEEVSQSSYRVRPWHPTRRILWMREDSSKDSKKILLAYIISIRKTTLPDL